MRTTNRKWHKTLRRLSVSSAECRQIHLHLCRCKCKIKLLYLRFIKLHTLVDAGSFGNAPRRWRRIIFLRFYLSPQATLVPGEDDISVSAMICAGRFRVILASAFINARAFSAETACESGTCECAVTTFGSVSCMKQYMFHSRLLIYCIC